MYVQETHGNHQIAQFFWPLHKCHEIVDNVIMKKLNNFKM